jgi:hypothetical protein
MRHTHKQFLLASVAISFLSGCATYRTESNLPPPSVVTPAASQPSKVVISEDSLPGRKYKVIGPVDISVKKLTVFHSDPTREMANDALIAKAREMGADAVIEVEYKSGVGLTTWGYLDAKGKGVKLSD